jgi:REP element-mobilizing transposase RayT
MAHTFSRNHIHLVFSTKDRRNIIAKEWQPRLWAYLGGICKNNEMVALGIGGTENHVHMLIHLPPKLALAKAVLLLKTNSSKWMRQHGKDFSWQDGCGLYLEPAGNVIRSV